ncbi:hypothetical protein Pst134EB_018295 [Puccinia striiformis f. sp. tritici]|nr:hypothetical protein Pst134EB_018295 [Puccinia striiformis f. sp. tritici]
MNLLLLLLSLSMFVALFSMPTSSTLLSRVETKRPGMLPGYGSMAKTHAESYTHSDIGLESNGPREYTQGGQIQRVPIQQNKHKDSPHSQAIGGLAQLFSDGRPDPPPPVRKIRIKSVKSTRKPVYLNTEPPQKTAGYKAEDELTEAEVWTILDS